MRPALPLRLLTFLALALVWSGIATAEIYKWVDEKGVTNYGSTPPGKAKAKVLDPQSAMVSVYTAPPQQEATRALEAAMRSRMARLEDELTAERRARTAAQASAQTDSDRRLIAYEQCVRDRRVDCDPVRDGTYAAPYYGGGYYYATVPVYPVHPAWRRHPPQTPAVVPLVPPIVPVLPPLPHFQPLPSMAMAPAFQPATTRPPGGAQPGRSRQSR